MCAELELLKFSIKLPGYSHSAWGSGSAYICT